MLRQVEGSHAVADTIACCRPEVICAYPISPQTHIVEALSGLVKSGGLTGCEYVNVESEFAAMSVAIGASAAGARAYTATASQGLLYMSEAVYNASGLGLPIVMTVANRALGAPINIWNDHSDSMSQSQSGWIQLYAETNQEAADLHFQAFKIAEELSVPVMVCMDGFILTHAVERVDVPEQEQVDAFLRPFEPRQVLDPDAPVSIGAMVGPEAFTEVRYIAHAKQMQALEVIPEVARHFAEVFGRDSGGVVGPYRCEDAKTVVIALGSVLGTIKDVVDEQRERGVSIGVLGITSFRPFPLEEVRERLKNVDRVVVVEKALDVGIGGIVAANVRTSRAPSKHPWTCDMRIEHLGFAPDYVDYMAAWGRQLSVYAAVVAGNAPDTVLLLEHTAVYTAGKRTEPHERPFDSTPVINVDRGGKITWHGPGQLVGYPIVRLTTPVEAITHVRRLEEMMIRACGNLGVTAGRIDGRSGGVDPGRSVRTDRKIGAIGIGVSQNVTMHGFALNCCCDLSWAQVIVLRGIADAGITSLSKELGRDVPVHEVVPYAEKHLNDILG